MYIGVCVAYKVSSRTHYATANSTIYINESVRQLRVAQYFRHEERVKERERERVIGREKCCNNN